MSYAGRSNLHGSIAGEDGAIDTSVLIAIDPS
jgi:hypothetical protein